MKESAADSYSAIIDLFRRVSSPHQMVYKFLQRNQQILFYIRKKRKKII